MFAARTTTMLSAGTSVVFIGAMVTATCCVRAVRLVMRVQRLKTNGAENVLSHVVPAVEARDRNRHGPRELGGKERGAIGLGG